MRPLPVTRFDAAFATTSVSPTRTGHRASVAIMSSVLAVMVGLALIALSRPLAEWLNRRNVAFWGSDIFAGPGWTTFNRLLIGLAGVGAVVAGAVHLWGV